MAYRGFFSLDGEELLNSAWAVSHLSRRVPVTDSVFVGSSVCKCANMTLQYDDTWDSGAGYDGFLPGDLPGGFPGAPGAVLAIEDAPWYSPAEPASAEFMGFWVMDVRGLDTVTVQRDVSELLGPGGLAGPRHDATRQIDFTVLVLGCTNAGQRYGINWLSCQLRRTERNGAVLGFLDAHPGGSAVSPGSLLRTANKTVLTSSVKVVDFFGRDGSRRNRQAASARAEFQLTALDPYLYGPETLISVEWDTVGMEAIEWVHQPDCDNPSDCDPVVLYNPNCLPTIIDLSPAPVPVCGGCLPICGIEVRTFEVPLPFTVCGDTVVSYRVVNNSDAEVTANFYWRPCGSTDICDRFGSLQIASLPAGATVVADSVGGRPYAISDGQRIRTVGIVTTPTGAPWTPLVLDDTLMCWELVAETSQNADFSVELIAQRRDS